MMRVLFLAFALASIAPNAHALLCTPILGCSCTVTASDLDFESFDPLSGVQEAEGEIEVDCTGVIDVAPSVATTLSAGQYGSVGARKMRSGAVNELAYNIYTTSQHTSVWGTGAQGVSISGGLITLGHWHASRTMFGLATPTAATKPGAYSDTIVVRITW